MTDLLEIHLYIFANKAKWVGDFGRRIKSEKIWGQRFMQYGFVLSKRNTPQEAIKELLVDLIRPIDCTCITFKRPRKDSFVIADGCVDSEDAIAQITQYMHGGTVGSFELEINIDRQLHF